MQVATSSSSIILSRSAAGAVCNTHAYAWERIARTRFWTPRTLPAAAPRAAKRLTPNDACSLCDRGMGGAADISFLDFSTDGSESDAFSPFHHH
jgi:hypothetical protein